MSSETDDMTTSGSGAGASGSASSGGSSSDVVNDKDVERALANPAGLSQEMIKKFLENSEELDPKLVKQLREREANTLGTENTEEMTAQRQREEQEKEAPEVEEAAPAKEPELSAVEVIEAAKADAMDKAFAEGKNAFEGVEDAHKVGQELSTKTNDQLTGIKDALDQNPGARASLDEAVAGVKGLLTGALNIDNGEQMQLAANGPNTQAPSKGNDIQLK